MSDPQLCDEMPAVGHAMALSRCFTKQCSCQKRNQEESASGRLPEEQKMPFRNRFFRQVTVFCPPEQAGATRYTGSIFPRGFQARHAH